MSHRRPDIISHTKSYLPRHGHVFQPASRAWFAWQEGLIDEGALNQREAGKFFPATQAGLRDHFAPTDDPNNTPPADGKIASAGQATGLILDQPGTHWRKHAVKGGEVLDVSWHFTANHATRRWNYFITKADWDPSLPLSRDQFEAEPFYVVQIKHKPHWEHNDAMQPANPTVHQVQLPELKGYHVLLAVWEVANTGNAFYQVVDLDFVPSEGGGNKPTTPEGLTAISVTNKSVELAWNAASGSYPIETYRIMRNGTTTIDVAAPLLNWADNSVLPQTTYTYFISAIDVNGQISAPSRAITVTTPEDEGEDTPPTAPGNLHSMKVTANSVSLMWSPSIPSSAITHYVVYRDGREIRRVAGNQTSCDDTDLSPETQYRYFVAALDTKGRYSVPGNVLTVKTAAQSGGDYPAWVLKGVYTAGDVVSHNGQNWKCIQSHIAHVEDWAPGLPSSNTLWVRFNGH